MNYKYNFIDPKTGTHTQNIDCIWEYAKFKIKKHQEILCYHLEFYLAEFMLREKQATNDN